MRGRWDILVGGRPESPLRRLDPRSKLLWFTVCFVLIVFSRQLASLVAVALAVLLLARVGRVLRGLVSTLEALVFLIVLVTAMNTLYFGPVDGLLAGLKFCLAVATFSAFFLTTAPEELAAALVKLGISYNFAFTLSAGARFVPTVAREATEILDAYRARGVRFESSLVGRVRTYARVLVPLVVATVRRSLRLAEAMEARGFGYSSKRTQLRELMFGRDDWVMVLSALVLTAAVVALQIVL